MKMNARILAIAAVGLGLAAQATVIQPTSLVSGEYVPLNSPTNVINNAGMLTAVNTGDTLASATSALHEYTADNFLASYVSDDPAPAGGDFFADILPDTGVDFVFDLTAGGDIGLGSILLWNYGYSWGPGNQLREVEVRVNTEAEGNTTFNGAPVMIRLKPVRDLDADPSNDLGGVNSAQVFGLGAQNGRYVQLTLTDNFFGRQGNSTSGDRVGLGEVRFATEVMAPPLPPDPELPLINSFAADPVIVEAGETVTLSWSVTDATGLSIDQGIGDVTGLTSTQVVVLAETEYTLTAVNSLGSTNESVLVTIGSPDALIDPSLELPFAGVQGTPGTGWLTFGETVSAEPVTGWWDIGNSDGPNAAYAYTTKTNDGGSIYQAVTLTENVPYRLTAGVAQSTSVEKNDGKFALVFFNWNFSELMVETNGVVANQSGAFVDAYVEFTPTVTAVYHVGMRNRGYVPGTGANSGESTIFFDNVRLTSGVAPLPTDPIGDITILGPVATPAGESMVLSWDTSNRQLYDIQTKSNLILDPTWTTITNVTGIGGEISVTTAVNNAETFYQVVTPVPTP